VCHVARRFRSLHFDHQIAASTGARANRDAVARDHGFPHVEGNLHVPEELRQRGQPVIRVEPRAESHAGAELELRQPVTVARLPAQEMGCAHEAQAVGVLDVALPLRVGRGCEDGPAGEDYE